MRTKLAIALTVMVASMTASGAFAQASTRATPRARAAASVNNSPYLGIGVQDIDADRAKALNLREVRGVEVTSVANESPAAKAGIKDGDVILEFNGQPVEGGEQLARFVRETPVGRQVKIGISRNGAVQTVTATVEARKSVMIPGDGTWTMPEVRVPNVPMPPMPPMEIPNFYSMYQSPVLGIMGEALGQQQQLAEFFGVQDGVLVKAVTHNSAAEKAGIKAGDVIVKIDDTKVSTSREISSALRAARSKKTINITVVRNKKELTLPVTLEASTGLDAPVRAGLVIPGFTLQLDMPVITIHGGPILQLSTGHSVI
jgi:serine protease Do